MQISDEMATLVESIICDQLSVTSFDGYYEVDNAADVARAALEAVMPMIRAAALEEAASVCQTWADAVRAKAPRSPASTQAEMHAAAIRAMKGTSHE